MTTPTATLPLAGAGAAAGPEAASVAVRRALTALDGAEAQVVVVFAADDLGPERAAAQAQAAAGSVPVVGLTSDVLIGTPGLVRGGCSALALAAPLRAGIGVARNASGMGARAAGRAAAAEAIAGVGEVTAHTVLLLFLDQTSGDQADTVAGAYEVAGGTVPLAGGAAAGSTPAQLAHGEAHTDAVVALVIGSPDPIGLGMAHGCSPLGVPSIVTRSEGTTVIELDGRPAADVYLEKLGVESVEDGRFGDLSAVHPLAQPELSGDVRLRHVISREENGALRSVTHIPANAAVHFTRQSPEAIIDSVAEAVDGSCMALGDGVAPRAALVFDCAGRKHVLGGALEVEAAAVLAAFGPIPPPLAGLYTRGEIGRRRGAKGDRNHAVVVVTFA